MGRRIELGDASDDWHGWVIDRDGVLWAPDTWRQGFTPAQFRAMFFQVQLARTLAHDLKQARAELAQLTQANAALEQRAAFYRSQLVAESRLGLCLLRIQGE